MLSKIIENIFAIFPSTKSKIWNWWYQKLSNYASLSEISFMNYGFTNKSLEENPLSIESEDETNRQYIHLYDYVSSLTEITGKKILEIGSGRGGGANYITKNKRPASYIGIDFAENIIKKCNEFYQTDNLSFQHANALNLPFEEKSFDVVLNIESSHCYIDFNKFVSETNRVLKDGGYFLWADFRSTEDFPDVTDSFLNNNFTILEMKDITKNVLRSLNFSHYNKSLLIEKYSPRWLKKTFGDFAGMKNTKVYNAFKNGSLKYKVMFLQKK